MRTAFTIIGVLFFFAGPAQTLGGNAVYNFLKLPSTPLLTASGGIHTSYLTDDVGLAANNPALLRPELHAQMQAGFTSFMAGIKTYSLTGAYWHERYQTSFGGQIYFMDYGPIPQTDAAGNQLGEFRPADFVIQLSAARPYLEKWYYGATVKFIHSNYQQFRSSALAFDVGIHYADSSRLFYAGLTAKHMGFQLRTYGGEQEDLPFDLQIGLTKKLAKAPFGFSITAQQLHRFNLFYNDTAFNNENELPSNNNFFNKLVNHFVIASHIYLGKNLEATLGYNRLRRSELNLAAAGNGLNGFSLGLRVRFTKLQVMYARSQYQRRIGYNQLGLNIQLNKLFPGKDL